LIPKITQRKQRTSALISHLGLMSTTAATHQFKTLKARAAQLQQSQCCYGGKIAKKPKSK